MDGIVRSDDILGGEPRLEGTRIGVLDVYELVIDGESTPADIADQLDRSIAEIYTALAYYHKHPDEMRTLRQERAEFEAVLAEDSLQPPKLAK